MPWKVPITVDGLTYPVEFGGDAEPTEADIQEAVNQIISQPVDSGQGYITSALSSVGRGLSTGITGPIGGAGYLLPDALGGQALVDTAAEMEAGIQEALPVNPIYEDTFGMKAFNVLGQAGSMLATGGAGGIAGKALSKGGTQLARQAAVRKSAERAALGSGFLSGSQEGGRAAEQYQMEGINAYLRALGGGATEVLTEKFSPFGMAAETGAARRLLGETLQRGKGAAAKDILSEGVEEMAANTGGNVLNKLFAPAGVETPGIFEGNLEAGALGAVGGTLFAGVNAATGAYRTPADGAREAEFPGTTAPPTSDEESERNFAAGGKPIIGADGVVRYAPPERDTTAGVSVVVEGITIATIPPGSDLSPDDVAAFAGMPDGPAILKRYAEQGRIVLPEIVKPVEGVDETLTDEMNQNVAAGAANAPATVKALEEAQALYEAQTLARERQAAEETLRQQEAERAAAEEQEAQQQPAAETEERGNLEEIASVNEAELAEAKAVLSPLVPGLEVVMGDDFGIAPINVSYDGTQLRVAPGFLRKLKKRFPDSWKGVLDLIVDEELSHKRDIDSRGGESRAQTQWAAEWQSAPSVLKRLVAAAYRKFNSLTDSEKGAELVRMRDQVSRLGRITESASSEPDRRSAAEHIARLLSSTQEQASPVTAETSTEPGEFAEKRPSPGEEKPVISDPQSVGTADDKPTQTASGKKVGDKIEPGEDLSVAAEDDQSTPGMPGELTVLEVEGILDAKKNKVFARRRDMTTEEVSVAQEKIRKRNAMAAEMGLPQEKIPQPAEETLRQQEAERAAAEEQEEQRVRIIGSLLGVGLNSNEEQKQSAARDMETLTNRAPGSLEPVRFNVSKVFLDKKTGTYVKLAAVPTTEKLEDLRRQLSFLASIPGIERLANPPSFQVVHDSGILVLEQTSSGIEGVDARRKAGENFTKRDQQIYEELFRQNPLLSGNNEALRVESDTALKNAGLLVENGRVRAVAFDFDGVSKDATDMFNEARQVAAGALNQGVSLSEFSPTMQRILLEGQPVSPLRASTAAAPTPVSTPAPAPATEQDVSRTPNPALLSRPLNLVQTEEDEEEQTPAPQPITPTGEPQSIPLDQLTVIPEDMARAEASRNANDERWQRASQSKEPIRAIRRPDGTLRIMDGHHRYLAARDRGDASIPVTIEPPITPAQGKPTDSLPADQPTSGDVGTGAAVAPVPKEKASLYQVRASQGKLVTDADEAPTGWKLNEYTDAIELVSEDATKFVVFPIADSKSYADKLRALMKAEDWAIDNPVRTQSEAAPMEANYGGGRVEDVQPPKVRFTHTTKTMPGKGQKSGYYPGTYAYEKESGVIPPMEGKRFTGELLETEIYTLTNPDGLKKEASEAGFGYHSGNGNSEVKYLKSKGFKAIRRGSTGGVEIIVFDAPDANFQPTVTPATETQKLDFFSTTLQEARGEAVEALREAMNSGRGRFKGRNITLLVTPSSRDDVMLQVTRVSNEGEPQGHQDIIDEQDFNDELKDQDNLDVVLEHVRPDIGQARTLGAFGISKFRKPVSFNYRLRLREVGPGTAPKGFISSEGRDVSYDRPLTRQEMSDFEMSPVGATPLTAQPAVTTANETPAAPRSPAENLVSFTAANGQKLVGEVQSVTGNKATVAYQWNGKTKTQVVPVSQLGSPVASVATPPKYLYNQEQNTRKLGKHFPTALGVSANHDFRKSFASMARDTSIGRDYRMVAKLLSGVPEFKGVDLHLVADENIDYAGEYSWNKGKASIALNLRLVARGQVDAVGSVLHEGVHHVTLAKVRNPQGEFEIEVVRKINAIRESVREYAESKGLGERLDYELGSAEEFVAALFTRPDFQAFIASIPDSAAPAVAVGKFRSLLSEIFRLIAELVHGKPVLRGSALEQAMTTSLALFNTPFRAIETGGLEALNAARSYAGERAQTVSAGAEANPLRDLKHLFGPRMSGHVRSSSVEDEILGDSQALQRGHPEEFATISVRDSVLGQLSKDATGIRQNSWEHLGDLYHRAATPMDYGNMGSKVETFMRLSTRYSVAEQLRQQQESNAVYRLAIQKHGRKYTSEQFSSLASSAEGKQAVATADLNLMFMDAAFASMYERMQAFTPLQALGRNMAIAFGLRRYTTARKLGEAILKAIEGRDDSVVLKGFNPSGVNNLSKSNNQTGDQMERLTKIGEIIASNPSKAVEVFNILSGRISSEELLAPIELMESSQDTPGLSPERGGAQASTGKGIKALFPQTGDKAAKPINLSAAYQKAVTGKSSQWVTIKEVYEQAKADNPSLTPEAFMQFVRQQNDTGGVMISPVENVSTVEAAQPFVIGNAGVEMIVPSGTAASRVDEETDAEHLAAVEAGDMATAQAMVDAAANEMLARSKVRENGRLTLLQHETPVEFTVFKPGGDDPNRSGPAIWLGVAGSSLKAGHRLGNRKNPNLRNMRLFADIKNPLMLDDEGMVDWAREVFLDGKSNGAKREFPLLLPEDVVTRIKAEGYDGIIFDTKEDRAEMQQRIDEHVKQMTRLGNSTSTEMKPFDKAEIIVFNPNQIKSADPVTRDEAGNVIPLSQRFNPESPSILYAAPIDTQPRTGDSDAEAGGSEMSAPISSELDARREEAISAAVAQNDWGNYTREQKVAAAESFLAERVRGLGIFSPPHELLSRVTAGDPGGSYVRVDSADSKSLGVTINVGQGAGIDKYANFSPQEVFAHLYDIAQEEGIHVLQYMGLHRKWVESGAKGGTAGFLRLIEKEFKTTFDQINKARIDLQQTDPAAAQKIKDAMLASWNLYHAQDPVAGISGLWDRLGQSAEMQANFTLEMVRMLTQLKRQDFTTETGWQKFRSMIKRWLTDAINALRGVQDVFRSGMAGDLIQRQLADLEAALDGKPLPPVSRPAASRADDGEGVIDIGGEAEPADGGGTQLFKKRKTAIGTTFITPADITLQERRSQEETLAKARKIIAEEVQKDEKGGRAVALQRFRSDMSIPPEVRTAGSGLIAQQADLLANLERDAIQQEGLDALADEAGKVSGIIGSDLEYWRNLQLAANLDIDKMAMEAGRTLNIFNVFRRLTPEGFLRRMKRQYNATVQESISQNFDIPPGEVEAKVRKATSEKAADPEKAIKDLIKSIKPKPRAPREKIEKALKALFTAAETGALDSQEFFDALGEALGHPPLTAEQQAKIKKLTREINSLPKGAARVDKQQELDEELALWKGIAARDVLLSAWYANILSGISTQGIGLFGNLANFLPRSLFLAATNPRSARAYFQGAFGEGLKTGLREAQAALKGRGLYKVSKWGDKNMVSALELLRKKGPATLPEWIAYIASGGTRLRYVFRIMQAIDALAWNTAREGQAYLAAHRALLDQQRAGAKLSPEEFSRALIENLGGDAKQIEEDMRAARESLIASGQTPDLLTVDRMAREARNTRRSSTATNLSNRFADRIVMQQDPEGIGDVISSVITVIQKKGNFMGVPFGQLLIPFNKIVANLFEQSLDYTPVGALRSYLGGHLTDIQSIDWSGKVQFKDKSVQFDAVERAERMAASVTGTLAASVMFALASLFKDEPDEDVPFMIYGFGPGSKNKRDQMPKGWAPYSMKVGDAYIKFSEMPFGVMFAAAGNALDAMRYKNMDNKSSAQRLAYVLKTSAKGFTEQGVLSSFDTALEVLTFQASDKKFTDVPVNIAKGMVPGQGMLRDISVLFDPVKIKDDTITAAFLRDFPVVRRIGTRPALNVFGEPMTFDGRIPFVRRIGTLREKHPVADYLGRNGLSIPGMAQTIVVGQYLPKDMKDRIQRRALQTSAMENGVFTVEQDYNFRKRAGELTKAAVEGLLTQVPTITSDRQRENVQNLINRKVEIARRRAMLEAVPAQ